MAKRKIKINRAPVLTLWAAVVAERLGHDWETAVTLGKAVADMNAEAKGQRLGILDEKTEDEQAEVMEKEAAAAQQPVKLLGRTVPVTKTPDGPRALVDGEAVAAERVEKYFEQKFKGDLEAVREAMQKLAAAYRPEELEKKAYTLYAAFRPDVPEGKQGWGAAGELDLDVIR